MRVTKKSAKPFKQRSDNFGSFAVGASRFKALLFC